MYVQVPLTSRHEAPGAGSGTVAAEAVLKGQAAGYALIAHAKRAFLGEFLGPLNPHWGGQCPWRGSLTSARAHSPSVQGKS